MAKKEKKKPVRTAIVLFSLFLFIGALFLKAVNNGESGKEKFSQTFSKEEIPESLIPIYKEAAEEYEVSWELLAAVHRVETVFSTMDELESPAGAIGHTQFMPCTFIGWGYPGCEDEEKGNLDIPKSTLTDMSVINKYGGYGVDGNGNGRADPYDIEDAVYSTANYLAANGAADGKEKKAIFQYNQADWYVEEVLAYAEEYEKHYVAVKNKEYDLHN
ncbi:lytic transglycosylase domain-containing protein [Alteribacillus bidgolensis]|uniref:Transglycosylase SLT domain-containing protein n=1 Tax=Alteribacillus bidgolensis TaxID=930129 RepID=A0A1G8N2H9_9BACI|nr:lytic transglycosylase domain-containing protein [Alteribacillus bidgolensis]SDI74481.1 Transglycosylase SLT domain-containing protein [Alteribacillus bidgolensis]